MLATLIQFFFLTEKKVCEEKNCTKTRKLHTRKSYYILYRIRTVLVKE